MHLLPAVLCLLTTLRLVTCELFTATANLELLLVTEKEVVSTLDRYIEAEQVRLGKIRKLQQELQHMWSLSERDSGFVNNPVNAFLLVKKLTADWKEAHKMILDPPTIEFVKNLTSSFVFPEDEDLDGAALALLRLQDTYALETSQLANGMIAIGANESPQLTSDDCFELGRQSYVREDFYHTLLWMQEAMERLNSTAQEDREAVRADILEYLAFATYRLGNVRHALKLTDDLLRMKPFHTRAIGNKRYYQEQIQEEEIEGKGDTKDAPIDSIIRRQESLTEERDTYERLCRGEKLQTIFQKKPLTCRYHDNDHPYMKLQPAKLEVLHDRPYIVMFHDIMTDNETRIVVDMAGPRLRRATVQNAKSGELEVANYRISKSAWLKNADHPVIQRLSLRYDYLTGLSQETAEELQVVNYGIGGHYEPHYDFARREEKDAFKSLGTGNRIATWINYMSDVQAGGATVFPHLGVTVWPRRGSAAFWHNLYKSGQGDLLTRHAACPVLAGSKWVSNKWFHERGQEFRRPCGLKETQ